MTGPRHLVLLLLVAGWLVPACTNASVPAPPPAKPPARELVVPPSNASPLPEPAAARASDETARAPTSEPPPCRPLGWVKGACFADGNERQLGTPRGPFRNHEQWFEERGVKRSEVAPLQLAHCLELAVGPLREEALACSHEVGTNEGYSIVGLRVVAPRKGHGVVLLDVLHTIGAMPVAPPAPDDVPQGSLFALHVDLTDAEHRVTLSPPRAGACAEAQATLAHDDPSWASLTPLEQKLIVSHRKAAKGYLTKVCSAARTFTWSDGKYR